MNRGQKKFLYGLFYIIILGLIIWIFIPSSIIPTTEPTINNIRQPLPLQIIETARIFKSENANRIIIFAQIKNPNADYGAENFSYTFSVLDKDGNVLNQISDTDKILPSESRYVIYNFDSPGEDLFQATNSVDIKINDTQFISANKFLSPDIVVISGLEVSNDSSRISIAFTVKNQSAFSIAAAKITVLIQNKYNDKIFAGETLIQNLNGLEERQIIVYLPADPVLIQGISAQKPVILINGE